jgi:hypothetical protein
LAYTQRQGKTRVTAELGNESIRATRFDFEISTTHQQDPNRYLTHHRKGNNKNNRCGPSQTDELTLIQSVENSLAVAEALFQKEGEEGKEEFRDRAEQHHTWVIPEITGLHLQVLEANQICRK